LVLGPISLRSPPALCFISYASGSTFQARYHSPGLLSLDSQPCSPPACTAQSIALSSVECFAIPLPRGRFLCPRINASRHTATLSSTEPVPRNGLSLAHNGCSLSEASIPGSTVPACYFATCWLVPRPVRPLLPRLCWFAPVEDRFVAQARCGSSRQTCSAASSASAPLQDFYLPRDRSVQQIPPLRGSPSDYARFPLAPRCRFYF